MAAANPTALTPEQTHALFDILTHRETYSEIEGFKYPDAVTSYGYPFSQVTVIPAPSRSGTSTPLLAGTPATPRARTPVPPEERAHDETGSSSKDPGDAASSDDNVAQVSASPVLQTLFTRFVLTLPWLKDLPREFWAVRVQGILAKFAEAGLSESYDKGSLGLRKTLATGSSALIEMVGRGALGRVKRKEEAPAREQAGGEKEENLEEGNEDKSGNGEYEFDQAEDLEKAWEDAVQGLVYGNLVEEMCHHMVETDDLEAYSPTVKGAALYSVYHLATFLHHIFVISPEGQYLLQLLQNVHNLIPYKMVKQTLRIGNAATMINGMVKLLLAKLSVGSITNWVGLTTNADDGMNLLQRIISLVLSWDAAEFKKTADKVEKDKGSDRPDEEILQAIRQFINEKERMEHDAVRAGSLESSQSIITAILGASDGDLESALSDTSHAQCLEYYSALLSVRDRDAITAVLCRQQPDLFTQMIRDIVSAYEPFIRRVHAGVDLREYLEHGQGFIDDFIKASKPKKVGGPLSQEMRPASVDDYVELLMNNRGLMYNWIHAVASQCPEVWTDLKTWAQASFAKFGMDGAPGDDDPSRNTEEDTVAESMESRLDGLFQSLPEASRPAVLKSLDTHAAYLSNVASLSRERLQHILDSTNSSEGDDHQVGPGIYLLRWHSLLDETPITPETSKGAVRRGQEVKYTLAQGKTAIVGGANDATPLPREEGNDPSPPDVGIVVKELGEGFVKILQEIGGPSP